jgi:hypothetical protein
MDRNQKLLIIYYEGSLESIDDHCTYRLAQSTEKEKLEVLAIDKKHFTAKVTSSTNKK